MPYTEMGTCVPLDQATTASRCRHARECDPREEPYALARTYGSVRGARGNPGPYRDQTFLSDVFQIQVTVAHYPAGASKWNPIEHLLFSAISRNWAGRPLECWKTILNYIRTTTNKSGLEVEAVRVTKQYETGIRISKEQMDQVNLIYNEFLPKWNYTINPRNSTPDDIPTLEACLTELKKKNETLIPVTQ